jgi:hypothetical protein
MSEPVFDKHRLDKMIAKLNITLSALRDALKGTGNKDFTTLEADIEGIKAQTDKLQFDASNLLRSAIASSEIQVPIDLQSILPKKAELYGADETVAQTISLDIGGFKLVEVHCEASTVTTFGVEISFDNTNWFTYYTSPAAETSYSDVFQTAAQYVRVSSAAAGVAGDIVSLVIGAKP